MKWCIWVLLIFSTVSKANESFEIPSTYKTVSSVLPVNYLRSIVVDPNEVLNKERKLKLACLLVEVEEYNQNEYDQTFYIEESTSIMKLFLANFPEFKNKIWEGKNAKNGGSIALSNISLFLNKGRYCKNT